MAMTSVSSAVHAAPAVAPGGWMKKRGLLLAFLQMPMAALVAGYVLGLVSFPVASFAVLASSAAFPAWVSYRIAVSDDPEEPVHHLHRDTMHGVVVVAALTAVLIPTFLAAGSALWELWHDLGAELTGEPAGGFWPLAAGVIVYGLVAASGAVSCMVAGRR